MNQIPWHHALRIQKLLSTPSNTEAYSIYSKPPPRSLRILLFPLAFPAFLLTASFLFISAFSSANLLSASLACA